MSVDSQHAEYSESITSWQLVRDCNAGSKAVKSRSAGSTNSGTLDGLAGTAYLPAPNATDNSNKNSARYHAYKKRANFVNFTAHTKEGLTGLVFRRKTTIETPTDIKYLITNANGDGLTTDQMIKNATNEVLMIGRYGLLVDYPETPPGLTDAEVRAMELQANILSWPAESVINWRSEMVGGVKKLTMVVLREPREESTDGFEYKTVCYHRVLLLKKIDDKMIYVQNVYDDSGNMVVWKTGEDNDGDIVTGDIIPRKNDGSEWTEIPFTFIGSVNNDSVVDKAPLYDIAEVNIAHYRNSADYEESSFMVGQPTPVIAGLTQSWVDTNFKQGIALGVLGGIMLPEGGNADLLQASPNQMPEKGMEMKEQQMMKIGANIIQDVGGNETVDAVKIRFTGQNSKLGSIIQNVEAAFGQCYTWAQEFMGGAGESIITINKEFYDATIEPQLLMAQIQLLDRGLIAPNDLRDNLRAGNLIKPDRTNEDIENEAETAQIL